MQKLATLLILIGMLGAIVPQGFTQEKESRAQEQRERQQAQVQKDVPADLQRARLALENAQRELAAADDQWGGHAEITPHTGLGCVLDAKVLFTRAGAGYAAIGATVALKESCPSALRTNGRVYPLLHSSLALCTRRVPQFGDFWRFQRTIQRTGIFFRCL